MILNIRKNKPQFIFFLVLPIIVVVIGLNFKEAIPFYSLKCMDPEMAYLYNGLAILHGHFPYFIDHPGIPLQYVSAIVVGITYLFRGGGIDEDVIKNPDVYIHAITYSFLLINAMALFIAGLLTNRVFKNVFLGLLIQLTPFASIMYLNMASRILPEFFALTVSLLFFLIVIYYANLSSERARHQLVIWFAFAFAYAVSIKITFLLFGIIPLIVLETRREKISYIKFSIPFLLVFLLPAILRLKYFVWWFSRLFINDGQYGQGQGKVVNFSLFKANLTEIYQTNPLLIFGCILLLTVIIGVFMLRRNESLYKNVYFRAFLIFTCITVLTALVIAKQLKYYYLAPAFVMVIPSIIFLILSLNLGAGIRKWVVPSSFLLLSMLMFFENRQAFAQQQSISKDREITFNKIGGRYDQMPIAVHANYFGAPFYGISANYGYNYIHVSFKEEIMLRLNELMPNFYVFNHRTFTYNTWDYSSFTFNDLLAKHDSIFLYVGDNQEYDFVLANSLGINVGMEKSIELMYNNPSSGERLFKLRSRSSEVSSWEMACDFESFDGALFKTLDGFNIGGFRPNERARSGIKGAQLSKKETFGVLSKLTDVKLGDAYTISVWRLNNGNSRSSLVVSSEDGKILYMMQSEPILSIDDWGCLQLCFVVNESLANQDVKIYCWQANDSIPSIWDDLTIKCNSPD